MPIYHSLGEFPRKRHIAFPNPQGGFYYEQLMGNKGFTGPASLLYHIHHPSSMLSYGHLRDWKLEADDAPHALRNRHLRTSQLTTGGSIVLDRTPILFNSEVAILFAVVNQNDDFFYRNASGDEVCFVSEGSGTLESQFGELKFRQGDYVVVPRGILHRWRFDALPSRVLIFDSVGYVRWPKRYVNERGQFVEGAPFSERDIRRPVYTAPRDEMGEYRIVIKHSNAITEMFLDHHPCDVVGWDGYYYPWAFSIYDFEPIVGAIHQPPPIHQTLQGDGFVTCSFCPRPFDFHPEAIVTPYVHSNVMSDEVLFYASSEFMSRKGIEYGSITLHPDGIPHGPHPGRFGTIESLGGAKATNEYAVMIDTLRPLKVAKQALSIEDQDYPRSWIGA
ncbi:homogentisate 1,2-dioxygenase [bacterium]|nr:homogentisate 1,2-dioxygenase [bacterium]